MAGVEASAATAARCSGSPSSSPDRVGQSVDVDVARVAAIAALAAAEVFRGGVDDALTRRGEPTHASATR